MFNNIWPEGLIVDCNLPNHCTFHYKAHPMLHRPCVRPLCWGTPFQILNKIITFVFHQVWQGGKLQMPLTWVASLGCCFKSWAGSFYHRKQNARDLLHHRKQLFVINNHFGSRLHFKTTVGLPVRCIRHSSLRTDPRDRLACFNK